MKSGIYTIVNLKNEKKYIGSTSNFESRWYGHIRHLRKGSHPNFHLQRAWNKYGEENFKFEIVLTCEKNELLDFEQMLIDEECPEYNIAKIAGSPMKDRKQSKEAIFKISQSLKGNKRTLNFKPTSETLLKMSNSAKGNTRRLGTVHTEETLRRMSEVKLNKKFTQEHKDKLSEAHKGKVFSEEHCAKISATKKLNNLNKNITKEVLTVWGCAL